MNTQHPSAKQGSSGFTLIELIVVVALVGILASIAIPSFSVLIASTKIKGAASNMHMSLLTARSEAIKRNASVRVRRPNASWTDGWNVELVADGSILATQPAQEGVTIGPNNPDTIIYMRSGRVQGNLTPTYTVNALKPFVGTTVKKDRCRTVATGIGGMPAVRKVDCP